MKLDQPPESDNGIERAPRMSDPADWQPKPTQVTATTVGGRSRPPVLQQLSGFLGLSRMNSMQIRDHHREHLQIALRAFPPEVQHILAPFDRDKDGLLRASDLEEAANAFIESKRFARNLLRLFIAFVIILSVLCGALGG